MQQKVYIFSVDVDGNDYIHSRLWGTVEDQKLESELTPNFKLLNLPGSFDEVESGIDEDDDEGDDDDDQPEVGHSSYHDGSHHQAQELMTKANIFNGLF